ncbi:MAG: TlpA disulfide reductase family protein [Bacteroidota bacterium]|nr:TlpA disulfide reductase family protein [Bacteroidota bacterium]
MRNIVFSLCALAAVLSAASHRSPAQTRPVAGSPVDIVYRPTSASPLYNADTLEIVYAFNYWGKRYGTRLALWENVLRPDSGQEHRAPMTKNGVEWTARIDVPESAALLSYYVTDGVHRDDNGEKTYVSYVYGSDGKPVRNARYFMSLFLALARADLETRIREVQEETAAYPDNFRAWAVLFSMWFERDKGSEKCRSRILEQLADLERRFPEDNGFLNLAARTYYYTLHDIPTALAVKEKIPVAAQWPDVVLIYDREKKAEEERRRELERKQTRAALIGAEAPAVPYADSARVKHSIREHRGNVVLLVFWASVSPQSRRALERIATLAERVNRSDFRVVAVNVDADENEARRFLAAAQLPFIHGFQQGSIVPEYGVDRIPQLFVIDRQSVIRAEYTGLRDEDVQAVESLIRELLAEG